MLEMITIAILVVSWPLLAYGQNDSVSGDGSGMFDSSGISLLSPTSTTAAIIAPSTSAIGTIIPSPLIGVTDYITSEQSELFVGMCIYQSKLCCHSDQTGNQCSCDLAVESCDPNCCCDEDCTNQIGTFTQCIDIRDMWVVIVTD